MTLAREEQIYRIDHYLGKDMIRNILTIRFANRLFCENWHCGAVEGVDVTSVETTGVEERLEYYDRAGAINDMVQSHLLQMVALVAMAAPAHLGPEAIRQAKIDVLHRISVDDRFPPVIGQYRGYDALRPDRPLKPMSRPPCASIRRSGRALALWSGPGRNSPKSAQKSVSISDPRGCAPVARKPSRHPATG